MTTAIHYTSVKQPPKAGQVYGLQVAVLDWLRAYMRYTKQEALPFLIDTEAAEQEIREIASEVGVDPQRLNMLDSRFEQNLRNITHVFRPDTNPHDLFWQRNLLMQQGQRKAFSFCGLAHAVAGRDAAQTLASYSEGLTSPADAIICPSKAISSVIQQHFDHYSQFVLERFGASFKCPVQLPVIPLGVHTKHIEESVTPQARKSQREALGIGQDDIVLLWVGCLSYAIKAHPIAMFRAAELAAQRTGKRVHLVMQGYFVPESAGEEFEALGADICKTAMLHFVAANDKRFPNGLWAAGDIFLSLIDNMQESFGLTPIEAIAAGLPRVLSDWDGYRDGVQHEKDGFLVPTCQPPEGQGKALASLSLAGRESYGGALAQIAQTAAVDHEAAAQFIVRLIETPEHRNTMAIEAKKRLHHYDWAHVIPAYEALWAEQVERRVAHKPLSIVHPHVPDPYTAYKRFPSHVLQESDVLTLALPLEDINAMLQHSMNTLAAKVMLTAAQLPQLISLLAKEEGVAICDVLAAFEDDDAAKVWRTLAWLIKLSVLRRLSC